MNTLRKLWAFFNSEDSLTWIGHFVVGFGLGLFFGPAFVAGAFVYREVSDTVNYFASHPATRRPVQEFLRDAFFDVWAPLAGVALAETLKLWLG